MVAAQKSHWPFPYSDQSSRPAQTGVLLLSSTFQVVHLNADGRALLQELIMRPGPTVDLPPVIRSFCQELIQMLPPSPESTDWENVRLSQTALSRSGRIMLRAFGIPSPLHPGDGQLLVLIDRLELSDERGYAHPASATPIHLTPREAAVMRYLLEGLTNKEIANKLSISEHTVKDHLKRLMKKTRVTTRTAVVSRLLSDHRLLGQLANATVPSADQDIHDLAV